MLNDSLYNLLDVSKKILYIILAILDRFVL